MRIKTIGQINIVVHILYQEKKFFFNLYINADRTANLVPLLFFIYFYLYFYFFFYLCLKENKNIIELVFVIIVNIVF